MKKILSFALLLTTMTTFVSCSSENAKWEYTVVVVKGVESSEGYSKFTTLGYKDQDPMLNKMGEKGWELVNVYTKIETEFPNFGDSKYVTGIRDNTRTSSLNFVFKRKKQ